ncbi:thiamine pyrophosphate-binding protein [Gammaproteobacteria bacterium]|nr:thiamine pyrophosphate-binding protein [Gammaproteobacteria bacterium]
MTTSIISSLLNTLADAGARDIFGVTGDVINPLVDQITKDVRFNWYTVRHEENAGYAASAQSELNGKIGVCAATSGPGALHLINGLYNAKKEGGAVVALTGQVSRSVRGSDYHKEMDLTKIFDDVCGYQAIIETPDQVPRMIEIAVQKALIERCVVRIELPLDIISKNITSMHFKHPLIHQKKICIPSKDQLKKASDLINSGKKITIYCGTGCRNAKKEVLDLAFKLKAPIAHTLRAKDIFDYTDGPVLGMTGMIGNPAGFHAVFDCDVLLMLGTDFPYTDFLPDGKLIIQVDINLDHIGRRAPVSLGLVGDVLETLKLINPMISNIHSKSFCEHLILMRDKWLKQMIYQASLNRKDEPLHPQVFAKAISDIADIDAIFSVDVGECTVWVARQMSMAKNRRMIGGFNHGSLGSGLPVSLGASALDKNKEVWAICGDGGFAMSMNDFITAIRYDLPIKFLIFNNSEFGFVKMEMETSGMAQNDKATGLVNPDFALYAKACGGDGIRVQHADEIIPAIKKAKDSKKAFIIDAIVSPGELVMPPSIDLKEVVGFGKSKLKEGILGIKGDHKVWQQWSNEFKAMFNI